MKLKPVKVIIGLFSQMEDKLAESDSIPKQTA